MELGCDPFIKSRDGKNAFHWATRIGNTSVLKCLTASFTIDQIYEMLNTETEDTFRMKPLQLAARFDHVEAFAFIISLEQRNRETCIHTTYSYNQANFKHPIISSNEQDTKMDEETDDHYSIFCPKCFTNNNMYKPDHNNDTIFHLMVRYGAANTYRYFTYQILIFFIKYNNPKIIMFQRYYF